MKRAARVLLALLLVAVAAAAAAGLAWSRRFAARDVTPRYDDPAEHFKYGSIGAEARYGIPWHVFRVLPAVCEKLVPKVPGRRGYEAFGFIYEQEDRPRPIGVSYRERPIGLVGLNCAACHTGSVRFEKAGPRHFVLGMPAHQLDLEAYVNFLVGCAMSPAFETEAMIAAMRKDPSFRWLDERIFRRYDVVGRTRAGILEARAAMRWLDHRATPLGPGRIDTPGLLAALSDGEANGRSAADHPSLFLLGARRGQRLGWDGLADSPQAIARAMALAAGATPSSIDQPAIDRVLDFVAARRPPAWPQPLNASGVAEGKELFDTYCARCHVGAREAGGRATAPAELRTDPRRLDALTGALAARVSAQLGAPFEPAPGYLNVPLDGLWLRAPYLHNGAAPTLRALLSPPAERPRRVVSGYDVYDFEAGGFQSRGCEKRETGPCFLTEISGTVRVVELEGNAADGHLYGTELPPEQRNALAFYLKTL